MLADALEYAENGWAVFPLRGKRPYPRSRGHHDATTDLEQVAQWWANAPDANIGAPVPANLIVIDIDPRNGGCVDALGPLPRTLTAWSGRNDGGRHLYFVRPRVPVVSTRLPDGIDLKVNGYMVMPPSVHPDTGMEYRWEHAQVAHVPPRLLDLIRYRPDPRPKIVAGGATNGDALVAYVAKQPVGNRNAALYWAACTAATEGTLPALADDLIAAAVAAGETENAARATVQSAVRRKATT